MTLAIEQPGPGHNQPPVPTPYERVRDKAEDLYGEAKIWLDGAKVESQATADGLQKLLRMLQEARIDTDKARKTEKAPLDAAVAEVQARYKPLLTRLDGAIGICKTALEPWLSAQADALDIETLRRQEEARQARESAQAALRQAEPSNLGDREQAEDLLKTAKGLEAQARRIGQATPKAGTEGRAAGLRSSWVAQIDDPIAAMRWAWHHHTDDLLAVVQKLADAEVRRGVRSLPGFSIVEKRTVV